MRVLFQHLRDTKNIGDAVCSPFDYFDWGDAQVKDMRTSSAPYDVGIYGGGKIFGSLSAAKGINRGPDVTHIAWGVGTRQTFPLSLKYARARKLCTLIGSRDWGDTRYDYAPCPTCMSPLFDAPPAPTHDVVFYNHGGKTAQQNISIPDSIPHLSNNCASLQEALAFIASGATVISNSYHGVYWALLMGRKTVCIPFSNKFKGYRLPPHMATPSNWQSQIDNGKAYPEMRDLMRAATLEFKGKVDAEIEKMRARKI